VQVLERGLAEDEAMLGKLRVGDGEDNLFSHGICSLSTCTLKLGSSRRSCYEELKLKDASREGNVAGVCLRSARPTLHRRRCSRIERRPPLKSFLVSRSTRNVILLSLLKNRSSEELPHLNKSRMQQQILVQAWTAQLGLRPPTP
jgi:hypothetical protein